MGQGQAIVEFFKEFNIYNAHIIFDGTDMFSQSGKLRFAKKSKPRKELGILLYSRISSGDINDVKSFKNILEELRIKGWIVIFAKGFYIRSKIDKLDILRLNYILPFVLVLI